MEKQDIILHVDHMTKCFGDLKVLNDISFDVHRGEFLCIVGPTGCGKTTFLNCITGLYDLTGGQILVNGELVDTKKHNIAYIFQEYSTMSWLTVEENVAFGLKMKRMPKDVIKKAIKDMESSKDVSLYGTINRIQILGMKVLPHRLVKKIWMIYQELDGTKEIR